MNDGDFTMKEKEGILGENCGDGSPFEEPSIIKNADLQRNEESVLESHKELQQFKDLDSSKRKNAYVSYYLHNKQKNPNSKANYKKIQNRINDSSASVLQNISMPSLDSFQSLDQNDTLHEEMLEEISTLKMTIQYMKQHLKV